MSGRQLLSGPRVFGTILAGQVVSLFGSTLTSFVLGVWVFRETGSATQFSLIAFFALIPDVLLAPISGTLVDRWNRRWAMILSDSGAGIGTMVLALLVWSGGLQVWHVYCVVLWSATFSSFQGPAFQAAVPQLIPKHQLVRANSVVNMATSGAGMLAPLAAGALLDLIQLHGVIFVDLGTFFFAVSMLLLVRIPAPEPSAAGTVKTQGFWQEFSLGWRFVRPHKGLLSLLALFAFINLAFGMMAVLITPLILGFASATALGTIMSVGALGFFFGSLTLSVWGGPKNKVRSILLFFLLQGSILFVGGLQPQVWLIAGASFAFSFCSPMLLSCTQAIWQSKVPLDLQGRVYAVRRLVAMSALPLSYLAAGPLADHIFEPLMVVGGPLASSVGRIIGTGPGRGVGLLFIVLGLVIWVGVGVASSYGPLRRLEQEVPDAIPDTPVAPAPVVPATPVASES
jgi:MFS family permease